MLVTIYQDETASYHSCMQVGLLVPLIFKAYGDLQYYGTLAEVVVSVWRERKRERKGSITSPHYIRMMAHRHIHCLSEGSAKLQVPWASWFFLAPRGCLGKESRKHVGRNYLTKL